MHAPASLVGERGQLHVFLPVCEERGLRVQPTNPEGDLRRCTFSNRGMQNKIRHKMHHTAHFSFISITTLSISVRGYTVHVCTVLIRKHVTRVPSMTQQQRRCEAAVCSSSRTPGDRASRRPALSLIHTFPIPLLTF